MSVASRARSKPPRSPDSCQNQGPFSAKPSRSRGVLTLNVERLRAGFPWRRGHSGRSACSPSRVARLVRRDPHRSRRDPFRPSRTPKAGAIQDCNRLAEWGKLVAENRSGPAAAVSVGSRYKSHVMRRGTRGWDAYSTERSPAQLNAKVVLEPPFGAATLPIMNRRSCIGAALKGCSCVFSNPGGADHLVHRGLRYPFLGLRNDSGESCAAQLDLNCAASLKRGEILYHLLRFRSSLS